MQGSYATFREAQRCESHISITGIPLSLLLQNYYFPRQRLIWQIVKLKQILLPEAKPRVMSSGGWQLVISPYTKDSIYLLIQYWFYDTVKQNFIFLWHATFIYSPKFSFILHFIPDISSQVLNHNLFCYIKFYLNDYLWLKVLLFEFN